MIERIGVFGKPAAFARYVKSERLEQDRQQTVQFKALATAVFNYDFLVEVFDGETKRSAKRNNIEIFERDRVEMCPLDCGQVFRTR